MKVICKNVRLTFPVLWEPKAMANDPKSKPAYSAGAVFPHEHPCVKLISDAIRTEAKKKWKGDAPAILAQLKAADRLCLHNGDLKKQYDGYAGNLFISARNERVRPLVVDRDGRTPLNEADGRPYGGCYVDLRVEIYAQSNAYGKRVNASLKGVQFLRDGDAFGAGAPMRIDEFESQEEGDLGYEAEVGAEAEEESLI